MLLYNHDITLLSSSLERIIVLSGVEINRNSLRATKNISEMIIKQFIIKFSIYIELKNIDFIINNIISRELKSPLDPIET